MMAKTVVEANPLPFQAMFDEATKWGFKESTASALGDLFAYMQGEDLPPETLKRWQDLQVINAEGKIELEKAEVDTVEWIMIGLAWEGMVQRVKEEAHG